MVKSKGEVVHDEKRRLASMISVRLAPAEERMVRAAANERGESVSTFVRQAALGACAIEATGPSTLSTETQTQTMSWGLAFESAEDGILRPRPASGSYVRMGQYTP